MDKCASGKRAYSTREIAEDVLIESWIRFAYTLGNGPIAVYQCEDCGWFHLTSKGAMNERLASALADGTIARHREGRNWTEKFKRK